jgi:hypothetical protein
MSPTRGQVGRVRPQVVEQHLAQRMMFRPRCLHGPVDQAARQPPDVSEFGPVRLPRGNHIFTL